MKGVGIGRIQISRTFSSKGAKFDFSRELNLIVAAQLSEQITDEVYEALMRSYKILVGDASAIRIDSPPRRSRLSSSGSSRHGTSDISITDSTHQSDHSPLVSNLVCFNPEILCDF